MATPTETGEHRLRKALELNGQRLTGQRAAVFRCLSGTDSHPTADDVFLHVRRELPGISLATVYKSLEALVGCGLAAKLTYGDGSARYDGRTDPHHHVRCLVCGRVSDVPGHVPTSDVLGLQDPGSEFRVVGYRLELSAYCRECDPEVRTGSPDTEVRSA